jgi:hypothetical protein
VGARGLRRYRILTVAAAFAAVLTAGGCALINEGSPKVCPSTAILDDAGELVRFAPSTAKGPGDVVFSAHMKYISGVCDMNEKEVVMELSTWMETSRGPSNESGQVNFAYFVAILGKDKTVLTRVKFPMIAKFQGRETKLDFGDAVTVTIPRKQGDVPKDYIVYIGYEMTPAELAYNRKKSQQK